MKRLLAFLLLVALVLTMVPAIAPAASAEAVTGLVWKQGTYYDNAINPNLASRKYAVLDVSQGDEIRFVYPSTNWAIYLYYADENGSFGYVTSKQGANETFTVGQINGRVPTQLRLTAFHRSGSNVTITDALWQTFDVEIYKTQAAPTPTEKTFTFATQNVGLWYDGVNQGVPANMVEARAKAWQEVAAKHDIDIWVGQEWLPYLDSDKTVTANDKVFGGMYPYRYGNNTSTYDGKMIISRTPLTNVSYVTQVSNVGRRYAKAYTMIGGKQVCIIDAHLSFEEDINVNRKEEIVELLNVAQSEQYVIIAGDFNVFTADEFAIFEEAGYSLANAGAFGEFNTWPNLGRNPTADVNRVIDNIIVSPGIKIRNAYAEDHQLSDHALLVAELELLEEDSFEDNRLLCEHCGQFVTWIPISYTNGGTANAVRDSGHYYLPQDLTKVSSQFYIGVLNEATPDVVIDLRGHTVKSTGRAFYVRKGSKLTIVDTVGCGTVSGASTATGGLAYIENSCTLNIYDGAFYSTGTPTADRKGGTFYLETSATMNLYGGEIYGGKASHGGVICGGNKNTVNIYGGVISGGTATTAGGAIHLTGGTLTMNAGMITGGKGGSGGGLYMSGTGVNLLGGTITGNSGTYGGNVHIDSSNSTCLNLGNCTVTNGVASGAGANIYLSGTGKMKVLKTFAGETSLAVNPTHLVGKNPGDALNTALDSAEGHFPGKLILESLSSKPQLCGADGETSLYIASAALVDASHNLTWYAHNKSAVAHYGDSVCIFPASGALELLGGNYAVDVGGKNIAITGTGTVTCFDSANDTFDTFGTVTVNGPTLANDTLTEVNGKRYVALNENGTWSFHRLEMDITGVALRPSAGGFYYTSAWQMDEKLLSKTYQAGVAVSLAGAPSLELMAQDQLLWTAYGAADLKNGTPVTGVMIENVLKEGEAYNNVRGRTSVFGAPYLALTDGTILIGDSVNYSLYDVVKLLDEKAYTQNAEALNAFYTKWQDVLSLWELKNMGK